MKLLLCDDHPLFREGLSAVLAELDPTAECIEVADSESALRCVADNPDLDLVLLDLKLPGLDGFATLELLSREHPSLPVVIVSASEDPGDVRAALTSGAMGFIPKSSPAPVLRRALELVFSGGVYVPPQLLSSTPAAGAAAPARPAKREGGQKLTPRQLEVATLLAQGRSNRQICAALDIAEGTVKGHIAAIFEVLGVASRSEVAAGLKRLPGGGRPAPE